SREFLNWPLRSRFVVYFFIHPTHHFHGENPPDAFARKTAAHVGRRSNAERGDCVASPADQIDHMSVNGPTAAAGKAAQKLNCLVVIELGELAIRLGAGDGDRARRLRT
ncbi:hypothetical protein, partial [Burkholderia glumae]|uniref:hypothetical protein n=1 Tax=Burkholderia glumae TaxID=337 RepID=UPI0019D6DB6C